MQVDLEFVSAAAFALYKGELKPAYVRDAGVDLRSMGAYRIEPGRHQMIPTGIKIALPLSSPELAAQGLEVEAQVRSRSGFFHRDQIAVGNAPGTIDAGYQDEIKVLLENRGVEPLNITPGVRIAQLVVCPVFRCSFRPVAQLTAPSDRAENGIGSTGIH